METLSASTCTACGHGLVPGAVFCPRCGTRVEGARECEDYAYEAFISYRHLPLDAQVAMRLQRSLEGFRIPKQQREATGKERLGKCFRDEDELPTSTSLSDQIEDALKRARYLVVVCSPQTRESRWVQREVELFASYHGRDRILVALAEGEPSESFPELLLSRARVTASGEVVDEPVEPLAADFRNRLGKEFANERLRIAATLIGCSYDDLRQRMRTRAMRAIVAAALVVSAVSVAFAGMAIFEERRINESYRQIQISESEFLANEAGDLLAQGDRYQAVQVALSALPDAGEKNQRPFVPAAQMALEEALGIYPQGKTWLSCYSQASLATRGISSGESHGDEGLEALVASDRCIEVRDTATASLVSRIDAEAALCPQMDSDWVYCATEFAGTNLADAYNGALGCFDAKTGSLLWRRAMEDVAYSEGALATSPDQSVLAAFSTPDGGRERSMVHLYQASDGTPIRDVELPGYEQLGRDTAWRDEQRLAFSEDGSKLAVCWFGTLFQVDVATGAYEQASLAYEAPVAARYVDGLLAVVTQPGDHHFLLDDPTCLQVFDAALKELWRRDETLEIGVDSSGTTYWYSPDVCGSWDYRQDGGAQLVVAFGKNILLLDETTGQEVQRLSADLPFLGCTVMEVGGARQICACTSDGMVWYRFPYESNEGQGGRIYDENLGLGVLQRAAFVARDGRLYLSVWKETPQKRMVYRLASTSDYVENQPFLDNSKSASTAHWNKDVLILEMDDRLECVDATTLEPLRTIAYADFEGLDQESLSSVECSLSESGRFYLFGPLAQDSSSSEPTYACYRVGATDEMPERLWSFPGNAVVHSFEAIQMDDGTDRLVLTGYLWGSNRIVVCDPEDPGSEESLVEILLSDVSAAWLADGCVIAHGSQKRAEDSHLMLFDAAGQAVPCDLEGYALQSSLSCERYASLSLDRTRFVAACSDGALRLFDAQTGSLLWESRDVTSQMQKVAMTATGNVFVQDAYGRCVLVSGETGKVLKASSTVLPPMRTATYREADDTIVGGFSLPGLFGRMGLEVISLDEESFGPQSVIYDGFFISTDNRLFLYRDYASQELMQARHLTLEELVNLGNEVVQGHELSDSERHLFQVDD